MSKAQASYMTEPADLKRARKPLVAFVTAMMIAFMTVLSGVLTTVSSVPQSGQAVQAGGLGFMCSAENEVGDFMSQNSWRVGFGTPHPEASGRSWTAQEAFGSNVSFANYHGEGKADGKWFVSEVKPDRGKAVSPDAWAANITKYEGLRTLSTCLFKGGLNAVANMGLSFAGGVSRIAQVFAVFAFDSNIICKEPGVGSGCIDLLKVIGGTQTAGASNQGLIGALTSGVYIPLLVIIVCISGLWVGYRGIVQRKFREAMFGAVWILLSVIFGLTFLYKPALLAKAPMAVSNTVAACVVGGYTGNSCWNGAAGPTGPIATPGTQDSRKMCISSASGLAVEEQMSMAVNGLSCSIWEAFVLEPFSQGSFGRSVDEMNINDPVVAAAISKAKINPQDFCVNLGSTSSVNAMPATLTLNTTGNRVCNLAVYQMYLSTNAQSGADKSNQTASTPDTRWYKLIDTVASDPGLWEKWSPDGAGDKILLVFVANIASILGSLVIVVIAFFALLYYLTSVLMIAFAPLFFLVGVHPGRGRSILIGWAEVVVANVLKYMASAFFLIITIAFYAAVLGSAKNVGLTLLFILVLTGALLLYRKEIVNLIGKVNMGGEKLSNRMGQRLEKFGDRVGKTAVSTAGAAVGAAVATDPAGNLLQHGRTLRDSVKDEGWGKGLRHGISQVGKDMDANAADRREAIVAGAKDGLKREMKKGGGLVANATRQYDRVGADNKRDLAAQANKARIEANTGEQKLSDLDTQRANLKSDVETKQNIAVVVLGVYQKAEEKENLRRDVDAQLVGDMTGGMAAFAQMQAIVNRLYELKAMRNNMQPGAQRDALDREIAATTAAGHHLVQQNPNGALNMYGSTYQELRNSRYREAGVTPEDVAAGRISAEDAQEQRMHINEELNASFVAAAPIFQNLEGTMQRLDALKMERDIAERTGDTESVARFDVEIGNLEETKNKLQALIGPEMDGALSSHMNEWKDQRYAEAGLSSRTATADQEREDFVGKAVNQKVSVDEYQAAVGEYNNTVDERNKIAASVAGDAKRADKFEKTVEDLKPGESLTSAQVRKVRYEANREGKTGEATDIKHHESVDISTTTNRVMPEAFPARKMPNDGGPDATDPRDPNGGGPRGPYTGPGGDPNTVVIPGAVQGDGRRVVPDEGRMLPGPRRELPGPSASDASQTPDNDGKAVALRGVPKVPGAQDPANAASGSTQKPNAGPNAPANTVVIPGEVVPNPTSASREKVASDDSRLPASTKVTPDASTAVPTSTRQNVVEGTVLDPAPVQGGPKAVVPTREALPTSLDSQGKTAPQQSAVVEGAVLDAPATPSRVTPTPTAPRQDSTIIKGEVVPETTAQAPAPAQGARSLTTKPGADEALPAPPVAAVIPSATPSAAPIPSAPKEGARETVMPPVKVEGNANAPTTVSPAAPLVATPPAPAAPPSGTPAKEVVREVASTPAKVENAPTAIPQPMTPAPRVETPSTTSQPTAKDGAREVVPARVEGNAQPTPTAPPTPGAAVTPAVATPAAQAPAPPQPQAKEIVRETVVTPAKVEGAPPATPVTPASMAPIVTTPATPASTPAPQAKEVVRETPASPAKVESNAPAAPAAVTPAVPQATPTANTPQAKEVVREVVKEVPGTQVQPSVPAAPAPVPTAAANVRDPQSVSTRETPAAAPQAAKETVREVVREVETPKAQPESAKQQGDAQTSAKQQSNGRQPRPGNTTDNTNRQTESPKKPKGGLGSLFGRKKQDPSGGVDYTQPRPRR